MRLDQWQEYLETEFLEDESPEVEPDRLVGFGGAETVAGPFSVLMPLISYTAPEHCGYSPQSPDASQLSELNQVPAHAKRASGARRRVRVKRCIEDTSATETSDLNTDGVPQNGEVPRHVRMLIALGEQESECEIAQSSYKKPFEETRSELIARLLNPVLSLEEAARLLNVCPTTVRRYTNRGLLNYYRKETGKPTNGNTPDRETRQRRFRLSDILAFLEAQKTAPNITPAESDSHLAS